MSVHPKDVLMRAGGRVLDQFGVPAIAGARRGHGRLRLVDTLARGDGAVPLATYITRDGRVAVAAQNQLRAEWIDLDGDGVRETPTILLEGNVFNDLLHSEEWSDNTYWGWQRLTATANATTAPDGTVTADKLIEDSTAANTHQLHSGAITTTAFQIITVSCFVKADTRTNCQLGWWDATINTTGSIIAFDLSAGTAAVYQTSGGATLETFGMERLANGWWRLWASGGVGNFTSIRMAFRIIGAPAGNPQYNGDGVSGLYVWGGQVEVGKRAPSSYIKTVASRIARGADQWSCPINFGPPAVGEERTTYVKFQPKFLLTTSDGSAPGLFNFGGLNSFATDGKVCWDCHRNTNTADLNIRLNVNENNSAASVSVLFAGTPVVLLAQLRASGVSHLIYAEIKGSTPGTSSTRTIAGMPWREQKLMPGSRGNGNEPGHGWLIDMLALRGRHTIADCEAYLA